MFNFFKLFKRKPETIAKVEAERLILSMPKDARIGIFSHANLDPDGLYSALAFSAALKQLGYENVKVFLSPESKDLRECAKRLTNLDNVTESTDAQLDLTIIVDLCVASRLGIFEKCAMSAKKIAVFDHHPDPVIKHDAMIRDVNKSSAGEILFGFFKKLDITLTREIASLLYVSIMSDSQCLTVAINSGEPYMIVKELVETGFDMIAAKECLSNKLSVQEIKAAAKAITNMRTQGDVTFFIFDARKKEFDIDYEQIKEKSLKILSLTANTKILLSLVVFTDKVRGSLRSYCEKNVDDLAAKLGGGGHKKASGFTSNLPENYITAIVAEYFKK